MASIYKLILAVPLLLLCGLCYTQNLVPNPSSETLISCPNTYGTPGLSLAQWKGDYKGEILNPVGLFTGYFSFDDGVTERSVVVHGDVTLLK